MKNFAIERTDDPRWSMFVSYINGLNGTNLVSDWDYIGIDEDGRTLIGNRKPEGRPLISLDEFFDNRKIAIEMGMDETPLIRSNDLPKDLEEALNVLGKYGIEIERKCKWIINGKEI